MCRPDTTNTATRRAPSTTRLLLSLKSFSSPADDADRPPSLLSCFMTCVVIVLGLSTIELLLQQVFEMYKDSHPILEDETHRHILARHLGVDSFCCLVVSLLGWSCRHICLQPILQSALKRTESMPPAGHEARLYTYHPAAFRIALFFFAYQIKNLYDTIIWNDGPEFIFHHVFSLITAWGSMMPGCGHYYLIFFFGLSEMSTAVLCILSNFDDEYGVPGLGDAFPMTKVAVGGMFITMFILCRCILWPIFSRHFVADILMALKGNDPRTAPRKGWLKFFMVSLTGLSILQVMWLGQIFVIAKEELAKVGLL